MRSYDSQLSKLLTQIDKLLDEQTENLKNLARSLDKKELIAVHYGIELSLIDLKEGFWNKKSQFMEYLKLSVDNALDDIDKMMDLRDNLDVIVENLKVEDYTEVEDKLKRLNSDVESLGEIVRKNVENNALLLKHEEVNDEKLYRLLNRTVEHGLNQFREQLQNFPQQMLALEEKKRAQYFEQVAKVRNSVVDTIVQISKRVSQQLKNILEDENRISSQYEKEYDARQKTMLSVGDELDRQLQTMEAWKQDMLYKVSQANVTLQTNLENHKKLQEAAAVISARTKQIQGEVNLFGASSKSMMQNDASILENIQSYYSDKYLGKDLEKIQDRYIQELRNLKEKVIETENRIMMTPLQMVEISSKISNATFAHVVSQWIGKAAKCKEKFRKDVANLASNYTKLAEKENEKIEKILIKLEDRLSKMKISLETQVSEWQERNQYITNYFTSPNGKDANKTMTELIKVKSHITKHLQDKMQESNERLQKLSDKLFDAVLEKRNVTIQIFENRAGPFIDGINSLTESKEKIANALRIQIPILKKRLEEYNQKVLNYITERTKAKDVNFDSKIKGNENKFAESIKIDLINKWENFKKEFGQYLNEKLARSTRQLYESGEFDEQFQKIIDQRHQLYNLDARVIQAASYVYDFK